MRQLTTLGCPSRDRFWGMTPQSAHFNAIPKNIQAAYDTKDHETTLSRKDEILPGGSECVVGPHNSEV